MNRTVLRTLLTLALLAASITVSRENAAAESRSDVVADAKRFVSNGDDLGLRILARKNLRKDLTRGEWEELRSLLHRRPAVGWDVLYAWDRLRAGSEKSKASFVDQLVDSGDQKMMNKQFEEAFGDFQKAAKLIKPELDRGDKRNFFVYQNVLHSMGRALFGAKRFKEAMTVYGWIRPPYPKFRQVLFERMWAAFNAKEIGVANGAIAAQHSSYFTDYLEPEAYIVQIYLYKKLCRVAELTRILASIERLQRQLREGEISFMDWARNDFEQFTYAQLLKQSLKTNTESVSDSDRDEERALIEKSLRDRFEQDKKRLLDNLEAVQAYAYLAFSASSKDLPPIRRLPSPDRLIKMRLEMWPMGDAEDWLDELGHHVFIGKSECKQAEKTGQKPASQTK